jgi:hypothetical protein
LRPFTRRGDPRIRFETDGMNISSTVARDFMFRP